MPTQSTCEPLVAVLLATFNGERYLAAQLDSLLAQTYDRFTIVVRDDGSRDGTLALLAVYAAQFPSRFQLLNDNRGNLGALRCFGELVSAVEADVYFFCDQDDVWRPNKIELSLNRLLELEHAWGKTMPVLVHTDLEVVGTDLAPIASSYWRYNRLDPRWARRPTGVLVQNVVTGCTAAINKALRDAAIPFPTDAVMHDWWLALVAAAFGKVDHVCVATVAYRQHEQNTIGARPKDATMFAGYWMRDRQKVRLGLRAAQRQASAFAERFASAYPNFAVRAASAYGSISSRGFIGRRLALLRYGLRKSSALRSVGLLTYI